MAGNTRNRRQSAGTYRNVKQSVSLKIRFTQRQSLTHKANFWMALEQFRQQRAQLLNWGLLMQRMMYGKEIAKLYFEKEAQEGTTKGVDALEAIRVHFSWNNEWVATDEQIEIIRLGLEATEEMQEMLSLTEQLAAYVELEKVMPK